MRTTVDAVNVGDPAFVAHPYPVFAVLREHDHVHWHQRWNMAITVSHTAASEVLRDRRLGRVWADAEPPERFASFNLLHRNSMLETERTQHARLRKSVSTAFARGHVERLRPWVDEVALRLVDNLVQACAAETTADLVEHVAAPMPVQVIARLLGIDDQAGDRLRAYSNAIVKMYEPGISEAKRQAAESASAELLSYVRRLAKSEPAGMIRDLLDEPLSEDEVVGTAILLFMAGHEASVNLISNGVLALLRHREQWERLVEQPSLVPYAVEELIRYDSPLQMFERTAVERTEIAGYALHEGDKIAALLGAAARDPAVFTEPEVLDVARCPNPHLGFGLGVHYCLGAPLARMEATAVLNALIAQAPRLTMDGTPRRRAEFVIRGLDALPVSVRR